MQKIHKETQNQYKVTQNDHKEMTTTTEKLKRDAKQPRGCKMASKTQ